MTGRGPTEQSNEIVTVGARLGLLLGLVNLSNVNLSNVKLAGPGEKMRRRLRARGRRWAGYLLKLWEEATVEGANCYMRRPGERMPPPQPPRGGPRRNRRPDDWELAA